MRTRHLSDETRNMLALRVAGSARELADTALVLYGFDRPGEAHAVGMRAFDTMMDAVRLSRADLTKMLQDEANSIRLKAWDYTLKR